MFARFNGASVYVSWVQLQSLPFQRYNLFREWGRHITLKEMNCLYRIVLFYFVYVISLTLQFFFFTDILIICAYNISPTNIHRLIDTIRYLRSTCAHIYTHIKIEIVFTKTIPRTKYFIYSTLVGRYIELPTKRYY